MSCQFYKNDTLHTLNDLEREKHLAKCPLCAKREESENKILQDAALLKSKKPDPEVWQKIEDTLKAGPSKKILPFAGMKTSYKIALSAAAVFLGVVSLSLVFLLSGPDYNEKVLSAATMIKVEISEKSYLEAIDELELQTKDKFAHFDTDLMLLYRDKLETIDTQIKQCREAISKNPGNAHIRRYLLAALQDKKETLKEILDFDTRS